VDFPTFERPTNAISGRPSTGKSRGQTALMTNSAEVILRGIEKRRVLRPAPIAGLKARATSVTRSRTHFISPTPDS